MTNDDTEPKQRWSFREWIDHFLQDDEGYYNDLDDEDELTDPGTEQVPGSDDIYGDLIDDGIIESLIIVGLAAVLAFMVYYRQQRQLRHERQTQDAAAAARENAPAGAPGAAAADPQQQQAPAEPQPDRGMFPRPGDPEFGQWVAGGVAH